MKTTYIAFAALIFVALLLSGGMSGVVSAAEPEPMSRIRLEQGHTEDWNGGDYVAVNMTDGINFAWFGVVYGTEEHPAPITIVGATLRYLGGAHVVNPDGNTILNQIPIPVVTAFGQALFAIFEFDDTGYNVPVLGNYGAGNGLFDFSGPTLWSGTGNFEPVYKYVDLKRAWTLSDIVSNEDTATQRKSYDFSLYALNVTYTKVWDADLMQYRNGTLADGVVEKLEFRFHIVASAQTVTTEVPFYKVTLNDGHVTNSEAIAPRNFTGTNVDCGIKFDHVIQGWDPYVNATAPKIMLENVMAFGMFMPKIVEEWYNAQFVENHIQNGTGAIEYATADGVQVSRQQSDLPLRSQLLTRTSIHSMDNWEQCGTLTWVSNVTVDGEEKQMHYQIHAGDKGDFLPKSNDGQLKLLVVLGGYIYPMGANVVHDPSFFGEAFQITADGLKVLVVLLVVGVAVVGVGMIIVLMIIRHSNKKGEQKFDYRTPPEYRGP
jgi:hypothetical protein